MTELKSIMYIIFFLSLSILLYIIRKYYFEKMEKELEKKYDYIMNISEINNQLKNIHSKHSIRYYSQGNLNIFISNPDVVILRKLLLVHNIQISDRQLSMLLSYSHKKLTPQKSSFWNYIKKLLWNFFWKM